MWQLGIPFGWVGPCSMSWLQDQLQKAKAQSAAKKPAAKTQPAAMKGKGHTNKGQGKTKKAMSKAKAKTKK